MFIYGLAKGKALGLCGAKEEAAARESMDALWQKNVVTAADGYPELTRICKSRGWAGSRIATAVMTTMYTKPCAAGTRRAPRPS